MNPIDTHVFDLTRRHFLSQMTMGVGAMALGGLSAAQPVVDSRNAHHGLPHFAPKAKRIIYLFQSGGPSQLDLFDYKPILEAQNGLELPDSVRRGQRLTGMSGNQSTLPLAGATSGSSRSCTSWKPRKTPVRGC